MPQKRKRNDFYSVQKLKVTYALSEKGKKMAVRN
jgi:hypothetical protein